MCVLVGGVRAGAIKKKMIPLGAAAAGLAKAGSIASAISGGVAAGQKAARAVKGAVGTAKSVANAIKPLSKGITKKGAGRRGGGGRMAALGKVGKALAASGLFMTERRAPVAKGPQKALGNIGSLLKQKVAGTSVPALMSRMKGSAK